MRPRAYNGCRRTAESVRGMSVRAAATKLPATWQSCRPRGRQLYVLKPYGALDFVTRNSSCRPLFTHSKAFLPPRFVKEQQTAGHSLQLYMGVGPEDALTPWSCRPIAGSGCGRQVGRQLVGNGCPRLGRRASSRFWPAITAASSLTLRLGSWPAPGQVLFQFLQELRAAVGS